ncbi:hypothetical protein K8I61_18005 [bacterium]|nr:hypothetical protein [bacterium]
MIGASLETPTARRRRGWLILAGVVFMLEFALRVIFQGADDTYFYRERGDSGYREDRELFWVPRDRYASQWRVADQTPADSLIYTFGGSIVTDCCGATTNFSRMVDERLPGWSVVNFGTVGFTSFQSAHLLDRAFTRKPARLVFFCHGFNDIGRGFAADRRMYARNQRHATWFQWLLMRSKILATFRRGLRAASGFDPHADNSSRPSRVSLEDFLENLTHAATRVAQSGGQIVFITQAFPDAHRNREVAPYFAAMKTVAASVDGAMVLDVRPSITARIEEAFGDVPESLTPGRLHMHTDLCHLTDEGHALVADLIVSFLRAKGLARPAASAPRTGTPEPRP